MLATSATLPMEMLLTAESAGGVARRRGSAKTLIELRTTGVAGAAVNTRAGMKWTPELTLEEAEQSDIIYVPGRSEEHTSELQSRGQLVCRLLLEKKKN